MEFHPQSRSVQFVPGRQQAHLHSHYQLEDPEGFQDYDPGMEALQRDLESLGHTDHTGSSKGEWSQFELSATAAAFEARSTGSFDMDVRFVLAKGLRMEDSLVARASFLLSPVSRLPPIQWLRASGPPPSNTNSNTNSSSNNNNSSSNSNKIGPPGA